MQHEAKHDGGMLAYVRRRLVDSAPSDATMEIFLALMALAMLMLLVGGLYMLKDRANASHNEQLARSALARILLAENETMTRLDLERNHQTDERWKCLVCEFTNAIDQRTCVLCGTKRNCTRHVSSEEAKIKRSFTQPNRLSITHSHSCQSLRLSVLNPRQRYARKRKEWVRHVNSDGTAYWVRQNVLRRVPSLANAGSPDAMRPSSGFVTYLVRSSVHSDGRLTFAETTQADASTTIGGYRIRAEELELIDQISQLPFQSKYAWFLERMAGLMHSWEDGRIRLSVHRENILVESMEQLLGIQLEHIHYPMRIEFIGEVGIDAGGLQREWFSILFSKLLDHSLGLFMLCHRNNQSVCINPNSIECTTDHLLYFRGIGRLIGRALLEGQTMQARLCLPILKHFLGVPVTFSDLQYVDPDVYSSMKWIRENDGVEDLELTFSVTEVHNGRPKTVDLTPGGREIMVTDANKHEFLHLKLRYIMLDQCVEQLQALSLGLFEVIPQENLMVFDYQELELVLCGMPEIDVADWKKHTVVSSALQGAPLVEWFWLVLEKFTEDERARFLQFCTGSSRVPVQGFKGLTSYDGRLCPFTIRPIQPVISKGFPKVHTCFNRIELPMYETIDELEAALLAVLEMDLSEFSEE